MACGAPEQHGATLPFNVAGGLSSFKPTDGHTIYVKVATLNSLLEQAGARRVDFLSVDVEGSELEVLRGFSFETYCPSLILLEDFIENQEKHRLMLCKGYKLVRRTGDNSWYVPQAAQFPLTVFGHWQLLRKYRLSAPVRRLKRLKSRLWP
jgi:hypothetical protein